MSRVSTALASHAASRPAGIALQDDSTVLTYGELAGVVQGLAQRMQAAAPGGVALLADNGSAWALADLALHVAGIPALPLPLFFSPSQIAHALKTTGIHHVLTDQPDRLRAAMAQPAAPSTTFHGALHLVVLARPGPLHPGLPAGTTKVTFTSGTTGEPKGVCLGCDEIEAVAESLRVASAGSPEDRHLCLLPLATLLENIAGLYTPLLAGATVCLPSLAQVGLAGSSSLDVGQLVRALHAWRASTIITVPQSLQAITMAAEAGARPPASLRYVAVGGAPVSPRLLERARLAGLPVCEGYGLSECASVVAVNRPGEQRLGSVGKPLPHVRIGFAADGEILVQGPRWRGYLGDTVPTDCDARVIATGDLGHLDADGYLHLTGRKKNIFITSFGRNVAPEWVERELVAHAPVMQAAVFGEGRDFNAAVVVCAAAVTPQAIDAAIADANARLPDYARVRAWVRATAPFSPANGLSTHNGRPRRDRIQATYAEPLAALYPASL
jgi:long-chain acyl-CoA synthetase